jgi:membrane protein CcdC involved in cytochrome C biogenesis
MRDGKYKHNKWFMGLIALLILATVASINSSDAYDYGMTALSLIILLMGVVFFWPIDYLIYRKTRKEFQNKPVTTDPNFKMKRNIILGVIAIAALISWLASGN